MAQPVLTVAGLLDRGSGQSTLSLELLSGRGGLDRRIESPYIQKTGLALAGFHEYLQRGRIFVFGESEVRYLESLAHEARVDVLDTTFTHDIPCVLITGGWEAHDDLRAAADDIGLPLRLKVATGGYDGRGQLRITSPADIDGALERLGRPPGEPLLVEAELAFAAELSIIVARSAVGRSMAWSGPQTRPCSSFRVMYCCISSNGSVPSMWTG